jgi:hypothetical protein
MSATTDTALDLITGSLRLINVLASGEVPNAVDASDALQVLNDMVSSWKVQKLYIFSSTENILTFTPGKYQYSIGNPEGGTFTGTLASGSPIITGVTVPSSLIVNGTLTDVQAAIPPDTQIVAFDPIGGTVTMDNNALFNTPSEVITYTVPGDFGIDRPFRVTNAFTRITASGSTGLDYQIAIITRDKYTAIGLKGINGPWPTAMYYDLTYPLGTLFFYPNPSMAGELHLWTDTDLAAFTDLNQAINLPDGYARAIKRNLALELAPEYGKTASPLLHKQAMESVIAIKQLNAEPMVQAFFDQHILRSRRNDASWIMDGGFNR